MHRSTASTLYTCLWRLALTVLLLLSCPSTLLAQELASPTTTLTPAAACLMRSAQLLPLDPATALLQAEQALRLATVRGGASTDAAAAHVAIGAAYQAQRHYDHALASFRRALKLYRSLQDVPGRARVLRHLGQALHLQGDTGQARNSYLEALRLAQETRDLTATALTYTRIAELYESQRLWARALASHERAYASWQQTGDQAGQTASLTAMGASHHQLRHYSRALYYLRQALADAQKLNDSTRTSQALTSTGQVYDELGNYEEALGYYARALRFMPAATPPAQRATALHVLATTHDSLGNWSDAIRALREAVPLAERGGSRVQLSSLYKALADDYRRKDDYQNALEALSRYSALQDDVFAEQRSAQVAELQTRYETEKKEREIQLLTKGRQMQEANLQRQKLLRNALAIGALLLLLTVGALYRSRRQQARANRLLQRKNRAINRQKEELRRLNQTKDTLFSVISHDLRSPLSSLYSLFTLMNMGTVPPDRLAAHTQRLTRTLDVTLRLLDNLLNWSAGQMQSNKVRPEKLPLETFTEEALALLASDAERKSIQMTSQVPSPCLVRADPNMVRLVLRNLVGNAIKFTPQGGSILVAARRLEHEGAWEVSVTDTGVGIAPEDHGKVLGQDGHHTTLGTAQEKGAGLGLRLCKEFVERNGGRLSFSSRVGKGTTFWFTLPAVGNEAAPAATPATAAAAG